MNYAGYQAEVVFLDESHTIDRRVLDTLSLKRELAQKMAGHKVVSPKSIACRYCGAQPGEKCTKLRRARYNRKIRVARSQPHPDRCYDAKLATNALTALTKA